MFKSSVGLEMHDLFTKPPENRPPLKLHTVQPKSHLNLRQNWRFEFRSYSKLPTEITSKTIEINTNHNPISFPTINCRVHPTSWKNHYHTFTWENIFGGLVKF